MVLQLEHVRAAPWGEDLLEDINLNIAAGKVLGVIGPNGAGKTSLLNLITGDIPCADGIVRLLDAPLDKWEPRPRARVLAALPQLSLLNFPYSVEEVILLGRSPHETGRAEDNRILTQVMSATDTAFLRNRLYTRLSGGEKQRVQLARVFAQIWQAGQTQPRLLLLDEPTAALDLAHQQLILESIRNLAANGCAIVLVAHDFNLVAAVADQITVLDQGRQAAHGEPREVLTPGMFSSVFSVNVTVTTHPDGKRPLVISA